MSLLDARGLAISATDATSVARYEAALACLLGQREDTAARVADALAHDPRLVIAYGLHAARLVLTGPRDGKRSPPRLTCSTISHPAPPSASAAMRRRHAPGSKATRRSRSTAMAHPSSTTRATAWRCTSRTRSISGSAGARCCATASPQALPKWEPSLPGYGHVLGMHAFGLEENGDYAAAEATARESLRVTPDNAGAIHVIAHVMEMQGRAREGVEWLAATQRLWAGNPGYSTHLTWHLALFHIELDDLPAAISIYRDTLAPRAAAPAATAALIDATALLWRLDLRGAHVRAHWRALAALWGRAALAGERAFTLVHALLAFAAAARDASCRPGRRMVAQRPGHARRQHRPGPGARDPARARAHRLRPRRLRGRRRPPHCRAHSGEPLRRQRRAVRPDSPDAGRGGTAGSAQAPGAGARDRAQRAQAQQPTQPLALRARGVRGLTATGCQRLPGRGCAQVGVWLAARQFVLSRRPQAQPPRPAQAHGAGPAHRWAWPARSSPRLARVHRRRPRRGRR